jgi:hypothetical protein
VRSRIVFDLKPSGERSRMRRRTLTVAVIGTTVAIAALTAAPGASGFQFIWEVGPASGEQVVPGPGDPDGFGSGTLIKAGFAGGSGVGKIDSSDLNVDGVDEPTAIHIHKGRPGEVGPVLVELPRRYCPFCGPWAWQTTTLPECKLIRFVRNLDAYYIDGHTAEFPGGAIRAGFVHSSFDPDGPEDEAKKEYRRRCKKEKG